MAMSVVFVFLYFCIWVNLSGRSNGNLESEERRDLYQSVVISIEFGLGVCVSGIVGQSGSALGELQLFHVVISIHFRRLY
ncbi:MAG: hypothetical protein A6F71_09095 [Cycloclasticus sp. symbiont of Poecilosclerida sp. M]|nr:MAG: hypothetical protein A6F71_09095 [Cycloclasticus sp. symbiont of Poecilosclerida sp. M]